MHPPLVRCYILFAASQTRKNCTTLPFRYFPVCTLTFSEEKVFLSPIIDFEVHFTLIFESVTAYLSTFPLAIDQKGSDHSVGW